MLAHSGRNGLHARFAADAADARALAYEAMFLFGFYCSELHGRVGDVHEFGLGKVSWMSCLRSRLTWSNSIPRRLTVPDALPQGAEIVVPSPIGVSHVIGKTSPPRLTPSIAGDTVTASSAVNTIAKRRPKAQ